MTKKVQWFGAICISLLLCSLVIYQHIKASEVNIVLSCQNELVAAAPQTQAIEKNIMIADFSLQKRSASISYRYFSADGEPIATLHVQGGILSAYKEKNIYILNLTQSKLIRHNQQLSLPQHATHVQAFALRNIAKEGVHNLTIQIVKTNPNKNLALLYFLPSTNICACSLITMD
ncbi:hypothetical protein [Shewanella subflava]|uniref:Uncharacterized protein n=1 Tax=Shewanella subflava TaxID=2986476 RepID=A0ABT3I826_9GAMM|nr:hypothetical protein [Shewanella subflava]MCW3172191.1 hypothetical protein [Shewanella subflava]